MKNATRERAETKKLHAQYSAYLDVPSIIPATDAANLIRYVELVVAYRHPELRWLRFVPDESDEVTHPASNVCRYPFHIDLSTQAHTRPDDVLDAIIVEAGQALTAHCKPKDGRRPAVGLSRAESSLLNKPDRASFLPLRRCAASTTRQSGGPGGANSP